MSQDFERFAAEYGTFNTIQKRVASELLHHVREQKPKRILDIGAGSGTLFHQIDWPLEHFDALDNSKTMLALHPNKHPIQCHCIDFNTKQWHQPFIPNNYDIIVSSSALQWADNLAHKFSEISEFNTPFALSLFSANTFASLFKRLELPALLPSTQTIINTAQQYLEFNTLIKEYQLAFKSSAELLYYLKHSGVSSGYRGVNIARLRQLIAENRFKTLEFEVVYLIAKE